MNIFIYIICYKIKTLQKYFFVNTIDRQIDIHLTIAAIFEYWEHTKKEINLEKDQIV